MSILGRDVLILRGNECPDDQKIKGLFAQVVVVLSERVAD